MDDAMPIYWDLSNDPELQNLAGYLTAKPQTRQFVAPPAGTDTFVRFEDKYFLERSAQPALEALLEARSAPSYIGDGVEFNLIESLYFDSENLEIYRNHFANLPRRIKLRSRRYGPNGVWKGKSSHLELKAKEDGVCRKERFKIGRQAFEKLCLGEAVELNPKLIDKNPSVGIQTLRKRVRDVNEAIERLRLKPRLRVTYRRKSYEKSGFRVTFDDAIRSELLSAISPAVEREIRASSTWNQACQMHASYGENLLVLELKHAGTIPEWMLEFLKAHQATQAKFSKYCYSITHSLLENQA